MKTLTVRLPEALVAEIEAESCERKRSKSDVVRERLTLAARAPSQRTLPDAIADLVGSVDGLPADLCKRKKAYLKTTGYPVILTTDADFRIYRRHSRQVVPCMTPD